MFFTSQMCSEQAALCYRSTLKLKKTCKAPQTPGTFAVISKKVPFKALFMSLDYKGECSQPQACCLQKCKIFDSQSQAQIPGAAQHVPSC